MLLVSALLQDSWGTLWPGSLMTQRPKWLQLSPLLAQELKSRARGSTVNQWVKGPQPAMHWAGKGPEPLPGTRSLARRHLP